MTRSARQIAVAAVAVALVVTAAVVSPPARGAFVTSIFYQESATATDYSFGTPQRTTTYLTGTAYPLHQTLTAQTSNSPGVTPRGLITSAYDFADGPDGTTATYTIASFAQLSYPNQDVSTGSSGIIVPGTIFTLSAPAAFTATSTASATGLLQQKLNAFAPTASLVDLDQESGTVVFMKGGDFAASGTLLAGDRYQLSDTFGLTNGGLPTADSSGTGQRTLTLTLTAVPEPAAAGLAAVAGFAALARRRRRV